MAWRLAGSLVTLRAQINAAWPARSKRSDGTIGDQAHAARTSDHNPNTAGVVTAADFTHDPASADMHLVGEALRTSQDQRIKYVIWDRRLFSSYRTASRAPWTWGPYTGSNPHTAHLHISVTADPSFYDNLAAWQIGDDDMAQFTDDQAKFLSDMADEALRMGSNGADFSRWLLKLFRAVRDVFADN